MSKLILEPIQPDLSRELPYPRAFHWRGRCYHIRQLGGHWTELRRWWAGEGEREFFRALTDCNTVVDLCFEPQHGQWLLYQLYD